MTQNILDCKINAKTELLLSVKHIVAQIKCASITYVNEYADIDDSNANVCAELPMQYTNDEFAEFLERLDFLYDNVGTYLERIDGYVWLTDGTYLERRESDICAYWYRIQPHEIPTHLIK